MYSVHSFNKEIRYGLIKIKQRLRGDGDRGLVAKERKRKGENKSEIK
jgi:hypothetical protein